MKFLLSIYSGFFCEIFAACLFRLRILWDKNQLKWSLGGPLSKLCVTPSFSINLRCQIENQARDCRLLWAFSLKLIHAYYRNGGEMVSVLASNAVYRRLKSRSGQTKDYKIVFCCFSVQHTALRRMSIDWLAWNQDNIPECGEMSIRELLFQWASTKNPTKRVNLVQSRPHHHLI
jgi:hypothetical protein